MTRNNDNHNNNRRAHSHPRNQHTSEKYISIVLPSFARIEMHFPAVCWLPGGGETTVTYIWEGEPPAPIGGKPPSLAG